MAQNYGYGFGTYGSDIYNGIAKSTFFLYQVEEAGLVEKDSNFKYQLTGEMEKSRGFLYQLTGEFSTNRKFLYSMPTDIEKFRPFKYSIQNEVENSNHFIYSLDTVVIQRSFKYSVTNDIQKNSSFEYSVITSEYEDAWKNGLPRNTDDNDLSSLQGSIKVYNNGTTRSLPDTDNPANGTLGQASFGVTFKESEPAKWSIAMIDPFGKYLPYNTTSSWENWLDDEPYSAGNIPVKFLISNLTWAGQQFNFSGIPLQYGMSKEWEDQLWRFVWSGSDKSHMLFRENQNLETMRSTLSEVVTAKQIIILLLTTYGISSYQLNFEDFNVPVAHLQGAKPIDWIKDLLEIRGAEWMMRGDVFYAWVPTKNSNTTWNYSVLNVNVDRIDISSQWYDITNKVVISRAKEAGESINEDSSGGDFTHTTFGRYTHTFNEPLNGVFFRTPYQVKGFYSNIYMYNANDTLIAVRLNTTGGTGSNFGFTGGNYPQSLLSNVPNGVTKIELSWGARPGVIDTEGFGKIVFYGAKNDRLVNDNGSVGFDTGFTVTAICQDAIDKRGEIKEEIQPSPLIPNQSVCEEYAKQYIKRKLSEKVKIQYVVPLNLLIYPGDSINEYLYDLSFARTLYVEEVSHNFSNEDAGTYTVLTCRYYDDCEVTIV